jgi:thiamine transporter
MSDTKKLTEIAILVALAVVLEVIFTLLGSVIPFLQLPYGGRISMAMLPLFVIVYRHGIKLGVYSGMIYGLLNLMLDAQIWHWASVFLDYVFAFGFIGFSGLIYLVMKKNRWSFLVSVFIGMTLRFISSYISGVVLFAAWMPEEFTNIYWYSFVYNIYYLLPSMILIMFVSMLIFSRFEKNEIF